MFAVLGSGFGLYGYLPALVTDLDQTVFLPRSYEAKLRRRPELACTLSAIRWVEDVDAALACAKAVVIATPPLAQASYALRCAEFENVKSIVLEKPVAVTPSAAASLFALIKASGKHYRVGYSLLCTNWHSGLVWPKANSIPVSIEWTFLAHHFAHGLSNWKRRHEEGGGALRFYGIHIIALLAHHGYESVLASELEGEKLDEPERWRARFAGPGLPECEVLVDSRCERKRFAIAQVGAAPLVSLLAPFEAEPSKSGSDPRVGLLATILASLNDDDSLWENFYLSVNNLWARAEAAVT